MHKTCTRCKHEKEITEFHKSKSQQDGRTYVCKPCCRDQQMQIKFGMSKEDYDIMFAKQGGLCAICSHPPTKKYFSVDHNHTTGNVRALLCNNCNAMIGLAKEKTETLQNAISYIHEYA